jgi:hypothetical protein
MAETYRIEAVEASRLVSHSDFMRVHRIYTLLRLRDGDRRRLKRPQSPDWKIGTFVQVEEGEFMADAV